VAPLVLFLSFWVHASLPPPPSNPQGPLEKLFFPGCCGSISNSLPIDRPRPRQPPNITNANEVFVQPSLVTRVLSGKSLSLPASSPLSFGVSEISPSYTTGRSSLCGSNRCWHFQFFLFCFFFFSFFFCEPLYDKHHRLKQIFAHQSDVSPC